MSFGPKVSHSHVGHTHHKGHVEGAEHCVHRQSDIHQVSGIPNLRKKTFDGVVDKKAQTKLNFDIQIIESCIKDVRGRLNMCTANTPYYRAIKGGLERDLAYLNGELAALRAKSKPQKVKQQSLVRPSPRPSLPSTTASDRSSVSPSSDRLTGSKDSSPLIVSTNAASPEPLECVTVIGTSPESASPAVKEDVDLAPYLVRSTPSPVPSQSARSDASSFDLIAAFAPFPQQTGAPSDVVSEHDQAAAAVVAVPVEDPAERGLLERQYIETADRVRQVYALVMTGIASGAKLPVYIDASAPLDTEFAEMGIAMHKQVQEGKDAIEEHVLPFRRSDLKLAKSLYEQERNENIRFIKAVLASLPDCPEAAGARAHLEKQLERLSKPLPEDPTISRDVISSYFQEIDRPTPALSEGEGLSLQTKAQSMSIPQLREAIHEQAKFLEFVDRDYIERNTQDPLVGRLITLNNTIGVVPQGYITSYRGLIAESVQRGDNDAVLNGYFRALETRAGSYEESRLKLNSNRSVLCQLVQAQILPIAKDKKALETAMSEFHPEIGVSS